MEETQQALIIVDVQPDFCEDGALAVEGGNACAERIANFVTEHENEYDLIITTQDWHINPEGHFSAQPDYIDTWPQHCLADTPGADLHEAIASLPIDFSVKKGEYTAAYSGFEGKDIQDHSLEDLLRESNIHYVDVVGIAESHCVKETALDSLNAGFQTRVISDLTVPVSEELGREARKEMDEAGIDYVESCDAFGFYEEDEDEELPDFFESSPENDDIEDDFFDDNEDTDFDATDNNSEYDLDSLEDLDDLFDDFDDLDFDDEDIDFSDDADESDFDFSDIA
ncbi:MAG: isochorismatase family protein [Actinomycetaceae bacterium]|nr:isochorismatase family protein [Actinomycetaceae bacterium]